MNEAFNPSGTPDGFFFVYWPAVTQPCLPARDSLACVAEVCVMDLGRAVLVVPVTIAVYLCVLAALRGPLAPFVPRCPLPMSIGFCFESAP